MFENPVLEFQRAVGIHYIDVGPPSIEVESIWEDVEGFELEIALTDRHFEEVTDLISDFVGERARSKSR